MALLLLARPAIPFRNCFLLAFFTGTLNRKVAFLNSNAEVPPAKAMAAEVVANAIVFQRNKTAMFCLNDLHVSKSIMPGEEAPY